MVNSYESIVDSTGFTEAIEVLQESIGEMRVLNGGDFLFEWNDGFSGTMPLNGCGIQQQLGAGMGEDYIIHQDDPMELVILKCLFAGAIAQVDPLGTHSKSNPGWAIKEPSGRIILAGFVKSFEFPVTFEESHGDIIVDLLGGFLNIN
jgi:hypothetical protein